MPGSITISTLSSFVLFIALTLSSAALIVLNSLSLPTKSCALYSTTSVTVIDVKYVCVTLAPSTVEDAPLTVTVPSSEATYCVDSILSVLPLLLAITSPSFIENDAQ